MQFEVVALLNDVAQMDADPELDMLVPRDARVAFDHSDLDFDRAAHYVDDAAELGDEPVARALYDTAVMRSDRGIDEIATEAPQARQGAILVRRGKSAVTNNVGHQDCSELTGLAHERHPLSTFFRAFGVRQTFK